MSTSAEATKQPKKKRSIIYVDGFNFYYGVLKGTPHKWLNLETLFQKLRPDDDIQAIRYFTAPVSGAAGLRQETYLRALETLPLVHVTLGQFKKKTVRCAVDLCTHAGHRMFLVPEEKRTDVAIGVALIDDAYQDACERFIIVSGDSDLVPAVTTLKERFPKKEVINPLLSG